MLTINDKSNENVTPCQLSITKDQENSSNRFGNHITETNEPGLDIVLTTDHADLCNSPSISFYRHATSPRKQPFSYRCPSLLNAFFAILLLTSTVYIRDNNISFTLSLGYYTKMSLCLCVDFDPLSRRPELDEPLCCVTASYKLFTDIKKV